MRHFLVTKFTSVSAASRSSSAANDTIALIPLEKTSQNASAHMQRPGRPVEKQANTTHQAPASSERTRPSDLPFHEAFLIARDARSTHVQLPAKIILTAIQHACDREACLAHETEERQAPSNTDGRPREDHRKRISGSADRKGWSVLAQRKGLRSD